MCPTTPRFSHHLPELFPGAAATNPMKLETSNYVLAGDICATWAQHASSAATRLQSLGPQLSANRLLFKVDTPVEAIECVALAATSQLDFSVVTPDRLTPDLEVMLTQSGLAIVE